MATYQLGHSAVPGYVDRRRSYKNEHENRVVTGPAIFTANATGTTTTIVGSDADITDSTNVVRIGEEFKLYDSSDELKEETVFRITEVATDTTDTTVTFIPAAAEATASGDYAKKVGYEHHESTASKDRRLVALGVSSTLVQKMTENDKDYQLRVLDDPESL